MVDYAEIVSNIKTCKDWLEFIKKEESKDVVSLIIAMSGSSGFPGDK